MLAIHTTLEKCRYVGNHNDTVSDTVIACVCVCARTCPNTHRLSIIIVIKIDIGVYTQAHTIITLTANDVIEYDCARYGYGYACVCSR